MMGVTKSRVTTVHGTAMRAERMSRTKTWRSGLLVALALAAGLGASAAPAAAQQSASYARASEGIRRLTLGSGTVIEMLLDASNLGGTEVEVAEITWPTASASSPHRHGAIEIFYIVEGVLGHVVNGVEHRLEPGMAGVVRPGDEVEHRVVEAPVKAVLIWVPGGEGDRVAPPERWEAVGR
ncbi:MAG TPA: cupin domain-containing protein [Longimicrobiales bacterium]|nr:cupin domain-containing protein [Longimicrobiales bacterium]